MKNNRTFESFEQFLRNIYSQTGKGKRYSNYKSYIYSVIKALGLIEKTFLSASITQLKDWENRLKDRLYRNGEISNSHRGLLVGYKAFVAFAEYHAGLITY